MVYDCCPGGTGSGHYGHDVDRVVGAPQPRGQAFNFKRISQRSCVAARPIGCRPVSISHELASQERLEHAADCQSKVDVGSKIY
jgi:hypothetical protein